MIAMSKGQGSSPKPLLMLAIPAPGLQLFTIVSTALALPKEFPWPMLVGTATTGMRARLPRAARAVVAVVCSCHTSNKERGLSDSFHPSFAAKA